MVLPIVYRHYCPVGRNIKERFGVRIRDLRLGHGWSQEYFADHAGINRTFLSQIENGHKEACMSIIEALADSFKMTISELMDGI